MNIENNITMKELAEHFRQEQPHLMRYVCYRLELSGEKNVEVRDWRNYIFRALSNLCSSRLTASGRLRTIPLDARLDIADHPTESNEADFTRTSSPHCQIR